MNRFIWEKGLVFEKFIKLNRFKNQTVSMEPFRKTNGFKKPLEKQNSLIKIVLNSKPFQKKSKNRLGKNGLKWF